MRKEDRFGSVPFNEVLISKALDVSRQEFFNSVEEGKSSEEVLGK